MKLVVFTILFGGFLFSQTACVANPIMLIPLRFTLKVIDIPCADVVDSIVADLNQRDIPAEWINEEEGILAVGPVMEGSGGVYSKIQHSYELSITCSNELSTSISGQAALEGLNTDNKWESITDVQTVEDVALKFLRSLVP
jgi:hypothetical protein